MENISIYFMDIRFAENIVPLNNFAMRRIRYLFSMVAWLIFSSDLIMIAGFILHMSAI